MSNSNIVDKKYAYSSVVVALYILLFFLGVSVWSYNVEKKLIWFNPIFEVTSCFVAVFVTVGLSYMNRDLIGGLVLGFSTSISFMIGFLTGGLVILPYGYSLELLDGSKLYVSSYSIVAKYGYSILHVIFAFSCLGMFFGLLGYISDRLFVEKPVTEAYVFRDYWSNIYSLGKNNRIELKTLDQRLSRVRMSWNMGVRGWWTRITQKIIEPKPDLLFARSESLRGDVYDLSSGRRIASDVVDPLDLVSKYKPLIMNTPAVSQEIGGGRRLAMEELISRFVGWFISSKVLWMGYLMLSILLVLTVSDHYSRERELIPPLILKPFEFLKALFVPQFGLLYSKIVYGSCILVSIMILVFVWRWRRFSIPFFEKRPDERMLIIAVYLILALLYGMFYYVFTRPYVPFWNLEYGRGWDVWTIWLVTLTLVLGFAYIFIHREVEVTNVYFYDETSSGDEGSSIFPFKDRKDKPFWLMEENETNLYWVLRFMYFWRYEIAEIPHPDWERIEVWVDARSGKAKWVVSGYHYRELWYKVEGDLSNGLIVAFLVNFHTPLPFVKHNEIEAISPVLKLKSKKLLGIMMSGKVDIKETSLTIKENLWTKLHPAKWIENFGLTDLAASFCSKLTWSYWRYPWGTDNRDKYGEHPAAKREEQPLIK